MEELRLVVPDWCCIIHQSNCVQKSLLLKKMVTSVVSVPTNFGVALAGYGSVKYLCGVVLIKLTCPDVHIICGTN
jgi:hypothetical protein